MAAVISRRNLQIWAVGTLAGNMPGPAPFWRSWNVLARGIGVFAGAERLEPGGRSAQACSVPGIRMSVQAEPGDLDSWLALARRLESAGFHALLMGDHPGSGASPWPAAEGENAAWLVTWRRAMCRLRVNDSRSGST
jgi:hypothetical protein